MFSHREPPSIVLKGIVFLLYPQTTSKASGKAANILTAILQSIQTNETKASTGITTAPIN